ncbi:unnamed protein product [Leptidea sinapis]|uniref:Uncharacterized protein n=1 Tax=Leptidea sinapis TaxID=189913 RepID=A0A5E4QDU8_9NEOP|nr:unnamed protein product [Leptidea sinapis]
MFIGVTSIGGNVHIDQIGIEVDWKKVQNTTQNEVIRAGAEEKGKAICYRYSATIVDERSLTLFPLL